MQPDQNQNTPTTQSSPPPAGSNYQFIMDPSRPPRKLIVFGNRSVAFRLVLVLGGFVVLLILFIAIKNFLSVKPFNTASYILITQQQEEILHIMSTDVYTPTQLAALTPNNTNFVATTQLTIGSAQSQLLTYLKTNHVKVSPKTLDLKISTSTDTQLTDSLTTNTFNQQLDQIMQSELITYAHDLSSAYKTSHGKNGKALLTTEYAGARLLLKQISSPSS